MPTFQNNVCCIINESVYNILESVHILIKNTYVLTSTDVYILHGEVIQIGELKIFLNYCHKEYTLENICC